MATEPTEPPPVPFPVPAYIKPWRKWEKHEDEWLKKAYTTATVETLAEMLGRSRLSVYHRAKGLKLHGARRANGIVWSEKEISYLKEHYKSQPKAEISRALNKSCIAVYKKAKELDLARTYRARNQEVTLRCMVNLSAETIAFARKLGKGNFSEGIRIALRQAEEKETA
ncbi:MAG: hypothetical protein LBQ75_09495 [Zoogloeaceae bacterium]|jgi:biotin operon repressor|nr:hypothetical protein [Zoogloeaceae bacterium]